MNAPRRCIADFHIHSHYSLATSSKLTPEHLDRWAQLKGIDVVGTGDCTHPGWLAELEEKLEPAGNGLYRLKKKHKLSGEEGYVPTAARRQVYFMLTGEISSIYKKAGKLRKVHNVCVLPDLAAAKKLQAQLEKRGNIRSDGRPILGVDAKDVCGLVLESGAGAFVIPAHIWTPWFSVLGDKSGFNSLEECYDDLTAEIFAVETGLSSDPPMNRACSILDRFRLVSNSDAHSPEKLGREANIFDLGEVGYKPLYDALKTGEGFTGTVEFFPQEGKYHYDGHRKCGVCWDPLETIKHNSICPKCGKEITRGVMYRVAELADRKDPLSAPDTRQFHSITSLTELAAEIVGGKAGTKKAKESYFSILENVGSDFHTLLFAPLDEINAKGGPLLAEGVRRMRGAEVHIEEGYDGEFGKITVFTPEEISSFTHASLLPPGPLSRPQAHASSVKFDVEAFKSALAGAGVPDGAVGGRKPAPKGKQKRGAARPANTPSVVTDEQSAAVAFGAGVCAVVAGPGSGKTRVLTQRIARLIQDDKIPQENILAVTFSNKAAEEMRERLKKDIPGCAATVCTFHAFGLSVLREHASVFGRDDSFTLIDTDEVGRLIEAFHKSGKRETARKLRLLSDHKQGIAATEESANFAAVCDSLMARRDLFDLDDLIYLPVRLFREKPHILAAWRARYSWVLVDEFQDINPKQYELLRLLCGDEAPNLFVIGDPDQSIYGFRGADGRAFERLAADYPALTTVRLSKSFRCPSTVLAAAGQMLGKESGGTGTDTAIAIEVVTCETERSEADLIAGRIEAMMGGVQSFSLHSGASDGSAHRGIESFGDIAVLCRTSAQFEPIAQALRQRSIPVQVVGQGSFWREKPFAGMIAAFKTAVTDLTDTDTAHIRDLIRKERPVSDILTALAWELDKDDADRRRFIALGDGFGSSYTEFFRALALRSGIDDLESRQEAVRLMTIHAAKGLEFPAVFVPGCEEGIIPFTLFSEPDAAARAEEQRLLYVAATRTKKYLTFTRAEKRMFKGRLLQLPQSSLLDQVKEELLARAARDARQRDRQLDLF